MKGWKRKERQGRVEFIRKLVINNDGENGGGGSKEKKIGKDRLKPGRKERERE